MDCGPLQRHYTTDSPDTPSGLVKGEEKFDLKLQATIGGFYH